MLIKLKLNMHLKRLAVFSVAALAGFLFGYDVGIISGALLYITPDMSLDANVQGVVVAAVPSGALLASALGGRLNDAIGRRNALLLTACMFIAGSLLCAYAPGVSELISGRFLLGIAVGIGSFSAPLYIAELSPRADRGRLVTLNQLAITIGIMVAYLVGYCFHGSGNWRMMLGLGCLPAFFLAAGVIFLPRSPRWLFAKGRKHEAYHVLLDMHGQAAVSDELHDLTQSTHMSAKLRFGDILQSNMFKVLLLGILVSIFTQAIGVNAIIYYAPAIFHAAGFSAAGSELIATFGLGLINVLFTLIAMSCLDGVGRRRMLLTGLFGIILSLVLLSFVFHLGLHFSHLIAWLAFIGLGVFIACQALSTGPACWLIPSEIFPMRARGVGMSISVAFNWGTNMVVAMLFPVLLVHSGAATVFGLFLVVALIAWIYFYYYLPETKGVSLEGIEKNLHAGFKLRELGRRGCKEPC